MSVPGFEWTPLLPEAVGDPFIDIQLLGDSLPDLSDSPSPCFRLGDPLPPLQPPLELFGFQQLLSMDPAIQQHTPPAPERVPSGGDVLRSLEALVAVAPRPKVSPNQQACCAWRAHHLPSAVVLMSRVLVVQTRAATSVAAMHPSHERVRSEIWRVLDRARLLTPAELAERADQLLQQPKEGSPQLQPSAPQPSTPPQPQPLAPPRSSSTASPKRAGSRQGADGAAARAAAAEQRWLQQLKKKHRAVFWPVAKEAAAEAARRAEAARLEMLRLQRRAADEARERVLQERRRQLDGEDPVFAPVCCAPVFAPVCCAPLQISLADHD